MQCYIYLGGQLQSSSFVGVAATPQSPSRVEGGLVSRYRVEYQIFKCQYFHQRALSISSSIFVFKITSP